MLCKLWFGAEFWRVGPTVRTGQSHISRAFMCANTRLLYLSPNMSTLSCSPLPSALIPTKILTPAILIAPHLEPKMPLCVPFLLPFWADPCPWQASCLGLIWSDKNEFIPTLYLFWLCLATLAWTIKILSQAFSHFLSERPNLRPASIFVTAGNHFETTWGLLSTLVYTCLHLSALVFSCLLYSTHPHNCTNW